MNELNKIISKLKGICWHEWEWLGTHYANCSKCNMPHGIYEVAEVGFIRIKNGHNKDYQNNIADAWELFKEILISEKSLCGCIEENGEHWCIEFSDEYEVCAKTAPEAICKAYIAYKEMKQ